MASAAWPLEASAGFGRRAVLCAALLRLVLVELFIIIVVIILYWISICFHCHYRCVLDLDLLSSLLPLPTLPYSFSSSLPSSTLWSRRLKLARASLFYLTRPARPSLWIAVVFLGSRVFSSSSDVFLIWMKREAWQAGSSGDAAALASTQAVLSSLLLFLSSLYSSLFLLVGVWAPVFDLG